MDETKPSAVVEPARSANEVRVRGRLAAEPVARELPSGAAIVGFRIVVDRESTQMTRGSQQKSDWIECTAWTSVLRQRVQRWSPGDVVEVQGAFRRRFLRGDRAGSLVEIEMLGGRMVARAESSAKALTHPRERRDV